jgi:hypothetical protein
MKMEKLNIEVILKRTYLMGLESITVKKDEKYMKENGKME